MPPRMRVYCEGSPEDYEILRSQESGVSLDTESPYSPSNEMAYRLRNQIIYRNTLMGKPDALTRRAVKERGDPLKRLRKLSFNRRYSQTHRISYNNTEHSFIKMTAFFASHGYHPVLSSQPEIFRLKVVSGGLVKFERLCPTVLHIRLM
jgi:hypothetical protein